jgi:hypothetical protein
MFKEENLEVIPTITWVGFKVEFNVKFMLHNQVLRDGLELLALRQGERSSLLVEHVKIFNVLLCLIPMKEEYTQRVPFFNGLQPWVCKQILQRHEVLKTC